MRTEPNYKPVTAQAKVIANNNKNNWMIGYTVLYGAQGKRTYRHYETIHRRHGPAVIHPNGDYSWYIKGLRLCGNKSFQEASQLTDEEMFDMFLKFGDVK